MSAGVVQMPFHPGIFDTSDLKPIRKSQGSTIVSSQDIRVFCLSPYYLTTLRMRVYLHKPTFAIILTVLLVWNRGHGEEEALAAIRKAGGTLRALGAGWEIEFQRKGKEVGDDELAKVAELGSSVLSLNLRGTATTGKGLGHVGKLSKLRRLHLERTRVGDEGMGHLAGLGELEYLNLYGTKVTDRGLAHLASLKKLRHLYIWQTGVTERGCDQLAEALPLARIVQGVDLDKVVAELESSREPEVKIVRVELEWLPAGTENPPRSKGGGKISSIEINNNRSEPVKLYWVEYGGDLKYYAEIAAGDSLTRATFSKATWLITDLDETPLGYFTAPVEPSTVKIPGSE